MAGAVKTGAAPDAQAELYERDYYAWILDQVRALRERRTGEIDWENVAEEIEDLGKSEKRALESQLARLVEHLLKFRHAPAATRRRNQQGWDISIEDARHKVRRSLKDSPSLRSRVGEIFDEAYQDGRRAALVSMELPRSAIPDSAPWSFEQAMDDAFLPKEEHSE